ncbi:MAG: metallophosphoesterase [Patescibacteria group bacterium]|nr:metallophosphoesterase [Patescibacteria group bacterium]
MASPQPSDDKLRELVDAYKRLGSKTQVSKALGIPRGTLYHQFKMAEERGLFGPVIEMPEFVTQGDEEEDIEEVLRRQRRHFEREHKAATARKWFKIKINEDKPYGIIWWGDPHLDSGGCNWPLLEKHVEVARRDGIYGGNIGDTTDNWPWTGRLAKLWADAEVSNRTSKRLAEWFMFESGVRWLLWLLGNHDQWNGGDDFYKRLGAHHIPVIDWRAQFCLVHKNGSETRIDAAHGRKGSSIYNPAHGTLRAAKFGEEADLFVTGHIHSFKLDHYEIADRRMSTWLAQVRGYKFLDHYAVVNGFPEYQNGASILSVIDPETGKVQCFADVEEGAEYLEWKRR